MTLRLNGSTSGYVEIDSQAVGGNNTIQLPSSNGTANQFLKNGSTAGTLGWSSMVETASGVGIGTTSPSWLLSLRQDSSSSASGQYPVVQINNGNASGYAALYLNDSTAQAGLETRRDTGHLGFYAGGSERGRFDSSGRILAGTTATSSIASVASWHRFTTSGTSTWAFIAESSAATPNGISIYYNSAAPNNTASEFLWCADSGALRASIRSNGGLANYSANNANLSDRNAKKDISPAAGTWDCIKEWEIVNYRYKDQPDDADLNLGVIAQQVAESCPEVITVFEEAKDDQPERLGVKEQQMYWMAIKALQEAQQRIETLEASNADLAARLTALEAA